MTNVAIGKRDRDEGKEGGGGRLGIDPGCAYKPNLDSLCKVPLKQ